MVHKFFRKFLGKSTLESGTPGPTYNPLAQADGLRLKDLDAFISQQDFRHQQEKWHNVIVHHERHGDCVIISLELMKHPGPFQAEDWFHPYIMANLSTMVMPTSFLTVRLDQIESEWAVV